MFRVGNTRLLLAIARQNQQSFAVGVQPASDINALERNEFIQRPPSAFRRELTEDAVRLVEENDSGHGGWISGGYGGLQFSPIFPVDRTINPSFYALPP